MKRVLVRCWEFKDFSVGFKSPQILHITYPESNYGHDLITCLYCGSVYAVTVALQVYSKQKLDDILKNTMCSKCKKLMAHNYAYYPDTYVIDGIKYSFKKPKTIPPDQDSIVKEFEGIYETLDSLGGFV